MQIRGEKKTRPTLDEYINRGEAEKKRRSLFSLQKLSAVPRALFLLLALDY